MRLIESTRTCCRRPDPDECGECKQKVAVAAQLRKQLGEGQVAGKDDPRGEIKLSEQEIETITRESAGLDCSEVCPEVRVVDEQQHHLHVHVLLHLHLHWPGILVCGISLVFLNRQC